MTKDLPPHEPLKNNCCLLNPRKSGLWHLYPPRMYTSTKKTWQRQHVGVGRLNYFVCVLPCCLARFTRISLKFHQNFARTSNRSALKKGITTTWPSHAHRTRKTSKRSTKKYGAGGMRDGFGNRRTVSSHNFTSLNFDSRVSNPSILAFPNLRVRPSKLRECSGHHRKGTPGIGIHYQVFVG